MSLRGWEKGFKDFGVSWVFRYFFRVVSIVGIEVGRKVLGFRWGLIWVVKGVFRLFIFFG